MQASQTVPKADDWVPIGSRGFDLSGSPVSDLKPSSNTESDRKCACLARNTAAEYAEYGRGLRGKRGVRGVRADGYVTFSGLSARAPLRICSKRFQYSFSASRPTPDSIA